MSRRAIDFSDGIAMIVTDLHGDGAVYYRVRDKFLSLLGKSEVQRLIICGDLLHGYGTEEEDASLGMLLDVMRLQDEMGRDRITMLLGNHEMPHIYGITLSKGDMEFTPRFEAALTRLDAQPDVPYRRRDVVRFLMDLPFYARTKAGVLLSHAGASPMVTTVEVAQRVLNFEHEALLQAARDRLSLYDVERLRAMYAMNSSSTYELQAKRYLAVTGPEDPRYDDLLNVVALDDSVDFALLWDVLFSTNEMDDGLDAYTEAVKLFLQAISEISPYEQRVIVAGHIGVKGGFGLVGTQQLRLASYAHAYPKDAGRYLLLDCAKHIETAADLLPHLRLTFEE